MAAQHETFGKQIRTIKHDQLFLVDDLRGNIPRGNTSGLGLYCQDTRFISFLEIYLNDTLPAPLLSSTEMGYLSTIVFTNGPLKAEDESGEIVQMQPEMLQVKRESVVFEHLHERFTVANYDTGPRKVTLKLAVGADFRDMFEVRGIVPLQQRDQELRTETTQSELRFSHRDRSGRLLQTHIRIHSGSATFGRDNEGADFILFHWLLAPGRTESCELEVIPVFDAAEQAAEPVAEVPAAQAARVPAAQAARVPAAQAPAERPDFQEVLLRLNHRSLQWQRQSTVMRSDNDDFNEMMDRNSRDVHMLMTQTDQGHYVAAGIPWYVALFGRDSIITSLFCLSLNPRIARDSLKLLAAYQGRENNPDRDEEPGKILHELRVGELARLGEIPHTPYYGGVDSTPLWIILLYEYYRWTADQQTLKELWPHAKAAMQWCQQNIDQSPNGWCIYHHRPRFGILQQGWKDSDNSVMDAAGRTAQPPVALSEVQGYVFQARRHLATLAAVMGEEAFRDQLLQENEGFCKRFNREFWMAEHGYCALALDAQGRPYDVIASNPGHCLSTGIFVQQHARKVAQRLMADDMFSQWGIRTLSTRMFAYNPMSYHNGSVWPHDNAMIARGFARMGEAALVERVVTGLFNAARHMFYKRLPELFCGFDRSEGRAGDPPVRYPVACIPQAWAAASMHSLVQSMLNLAPNAANKTLVIRSPKLPSWLNVLHLDNLRVGEARVDLELRRSRRTVMVDVKELSGDLDIIVEISGKRTADEDD